MTITTDPATRPAPPARPAPAPSHRQRRNPKLAGLGLAVVALGGLAGAYLASQGGQQVSVVALTAPIRAGQPVTAAQLGSIELPAGTGLDTIPAAQLPDLPGKYANTNLPKGALLAPSQLQDGLYPPKGQSIVGVALKPSQLPARGLLPGDQVRLVITSAQPGTAPGRDQPTGTLWPARVVTVGTPNDEGSTTVDVQVSQAVAGPLAAAAGGGNLAAVLDQGSANAAASAGE
ncbi:SAF domain-containing protein [Intrasporangium sp.]|uniref:SAF domain-containing protein n=1 Tax=Intrasporangium sp. TaxID=1925024 RepID=UPI0032221EF0